jgi:hypothetical protein
MVADKEGGDKPGSHEHYVGTPSGGIGKVVALNEAVSDGEKGGDATGQGEGVDENAAL